MKDFRREMLGTAAIIGATGIAVAAATATQGRPDSPAHGLGPTQGNPRAAADLGAQNPAIAGQFPSALTPPATDMSDLLPFWVSFNNIPRRIQDGGCTRQVTRADYRVPWAAWQPSSTAEAGSGPEAVPA